MGGVNGGVVERVYASVHELEVHIVGLEHNGQVLRVIVRPPDEPVVAREVQDADVLLLLERYEFTLQYLILVYERLCIQTQKLHSVCKACPNIVIEVQDTGHQPYY
jgi:hypothetical protein